MKILFILFICCSLLGSMNAAPFCACCAERGTYSLSVKKPDAYEIGELKRIQIQTTELYTDAGYPETIKGIKPLGETFIANCVLQNKLWKFEIIDEKNQSGILSFPLSATMVDYKVDYNENDEKASNATLYKEWRFKAKVSNTTGIFQFGIKPTTEYFLVLQGRGNNCTQAEDFTHWRLEIFGKNAGYAFFGKLKQPV